jgi:hypothetical protein
MASRRGVGRTDDPLAVDHLTVGSVTPLNSYEREANMQASDPEKRLILLGAGASVDAGVPASFDMTQRMVELIQNSHDRPSAKLLNYICGRLIGHDTAEGSSPYENIDVERLIGAVRLLEQRNSIEIAPFVAAWDNGVEIHTRRPKEPFARHGEAIAKGVLRAQDRIYGSPDARMIEEAVADIAREVIGEPDHEAFGELFKQLMVSLRELLRFDPSATEYLHPLLKLVERQAELTIVTLNYDMSIELMAQRHGERVDRGFASWSETGELRMEGPLRLIKLHGSIDWIQRKPQNVQPPQFPRAAYGTVGNWDSSREAPLVVFGAGQKLRADGPFLDLFMAAKAALSQATELVVVGYSFRDVHINQIVGDWLSGSDSRSITIIDPGDPLDHDWESPRTEQVRFANYLGLYLIDSFPKAKKDRRFPDRLKRIKAGAKEGIAEFVDSLDEG